MTNDPRTIERRVEQLHERLLAMAQLARERVALAVAGLMDRDERALFTVMTGDSDIDTLHVEIDAHCFTLLALQQPVAVDLRGVVGAAKINGDVERIGDLAVNIAQAAQRYLSRTAAAPAAGVPRMAQLAERMLGDAVEAFVTRNPDEARRVLATDDGLDSLKDETFRDLLERMLGDRHVIEPALELILISRHLERIGDHATNIAEDVIFIVEARDVRHQPVDS